MENLLRSEINLSCANSIAAGNLGVFYAKVKGEHHLTAESVETRAMVYVTEGDIMITPGNSGLYSEAFPKGGGVPRI